MIRPEKRWAPFAVSLSGGAFLLYLLAPIFGLAQSDFTPPKLSNINIKSVTATSATVTWETDEEAESLINYGLDKNYGIARDPVANKKSHSIILEDLLPSTVYHLRAVSSDVGGNQAVSGDYTIITSGTKKIESIEKLPREEQANVERAIEAIEKIKTPEGLNAVAVAVSDTAKRILEAPRIIGTPHIDELGSDYAVISWGTDQESNSVVEIAAQDEYQPDAADPYVSKQGEPNERVSDHVIRVIGLRPGTLYHFRVSSEATLGLIGKSKDFTLTTKSILPIISTFRVLKAEEYSATLGWTTTVPSSGVIEFTNLKTKESRSAGTPNLATAHTVKLNDLKLGSKYQAILKVENAQGDKVISNPIQFTTVKDQAPPLISKVANESTLYPSAEAKVQTIVSWSTDEPAYCEFFYREGIAPGIEPTGLGENKEPKSAHVQVVVEFMPSTVYQYWVECKDLAGNKIKSENFVLFTPNKEKSIIDIILENFEGTFGWVKNIGK
jgi:hypothetical protein